MRTPLHAPSDWSAIFHFVASLTDMHAPLHAPRDWSAVFHFVDPITADMRAPLRAPSGPTAIFHFAAILIGIYTIHMFLLLTYAFSLSHETLTLDTAFAATLLAPALVITMIQTDRRSCNELQANMFFLHINLYFIIKFRIKI